MKSYILPRLYPDKVMIFSKVSDPVLAVSNKKKMFDDIFPKNYSIGADLEQIKSCSGIHGVAEYNYSCIEPNNITVNTRSLG